MCNVINKYIVIIVSIMFLTACAGKENEDAANAQKLLKEAKVAIENDDFIKAEFLLDSIDKCYPTAVDVRKEVTTLRPAVIEGITISEIESNSKLILQLQQRIDQIKENFIFVDNDPVIDGYYIAKELADDDFYNKSGIRATVSENGDFALVSLLVGRKINHTSITLSTGDMSASSDVIAVDNVINVQSSSNEMITYNKKQTADIAELVNNNDSSQPVTVTFNGNAKNFSLKLTSDKVKAIKQTYDLAQLMTELVTAELKHAKLNQMLLTARDQNARVSDN